MFEAAFYTVGSLGLCAIHGSRILYGFKFRFTCFGVPGGWEIYRDDNPFLFWLAMSGNGLIFALCAALFLQLIINIAGMSVLPTG